MGKGSTFWVNLEFDVSSVRPAITVPEEIGASPLALSVLLAEDNEVNVKVLRSLLERAGCQVDVARDGLEAISRNAAKQYDVILMDVQMPSCDGIEATKAIRAEEARTGPMRAGNVSSDFAETRVRPAPVRVSALHHHDLVCLSAPLAEQARTGAQFRFRRGQYRVRIPSLFEFAHCLQ